MASDRFFIDTWAWLVLANDQDPAFVNVSKIRASVAKRRGAWVTTDYVLDETITRLFSAAPFVAAHRFTEAIFESSRFGLVDIERVTPDRFNLAWRMRVRYRDKPGISFTNLTSFVVMRELGLRQVLTGDAHFQQVGMGFVRLP
jgi:predicted nucleic acid-binding protein